MEPKRTSSDELPFTDSTGFSSDSRETDTWQLNQFDTSEASDTAGITTSQEARESEDVERPLLFGSRDQQDVEHVAHAERENEFL